MRRMITTVLAALLATSAYAADVAPPETPGSAAPKAVAEKKRMMDDLANSFEESVGGVVRSVSAASEQINQGAVMLASAAEEASHQAQSVAASSVCPRISRMSLP